jgi:Prokaryotic cytochrome b561
VFLKEANHVKTYKHSLPSPASQFALAGCPPDLRNVFAGKVSEWAAKRVSQNPIAGDSYGIGFHYPRRHRRSIYRPPSSAQACLSHTTTGNAFLDWVGKAVHDALYLLVFLMALSGMSLSLQSSLLPAVFGTSGASLPAAFFEFRARMLHGFIAPALLVLVAVHVGAALYHQFALRDNLFSRMWYGKPLKESK